MKTKLQKAALTHQKHVVKSPKETLVDIFEGLIRDIYWAENHLIKALPKMANAAFNEDLRDAFNGHLAQTEKHVARIDQIFEYLDKKPLAKKCAAMEGLIKEGAETIESLDQGNARDAGLVAAAQKIEHYEISAYGTLSTMATVLGKHQCAILLAQTKDEETQTDEKLTAIAERIYKIACEIQEEEVE